MVQSLWSSIIKEMRKTKHGKITENPRLLKMWAFDLNPENPETISTGASKDDYY